MNWRLLIFCLTISLLLSSCDREVSVFYPDQWEFMTEGENIWVDSIPTLSGNYQFRTTITIDNSFKRESSYSLYLDMLASSIVYWDEVEIGRNGKVGRDQNSEIPGNKVSFFKIPDTLFTEGPHHVRLELSTHHAGQNPRFYIICAIDTFEIGRSSLIRTAFIHIYAGCFLIIGLFYMVRYLTNLNRFTHLIFSLLSLSFFSLIIVEFMRYYYHYTYSWHFSRLQIILGISLIIGLLLPLFFIFLHDIKHRWKIIGVVLIIELLCLTTIPEGYDYATSLVMLCGFSAASLAAITGMKKKKLESILAIIGLIPVPITMIIWPYYYDYIIYIGFGNLTLIMLILLAISDKKIRDEKEVVKLRSARLELELLKKNIQPHFMKNTLTSAIDWIERNPAKGTELIFALVEEFDLLLNISDRQLIPVEYEIQLCRKHLQIMSFRKEIHYKLNQSDIIQGEMIPPAILLTVIENGITHQRGQPETITFSIKRKAKGGQITYEISSDGTYHDKDKKEGTGTKYIKARLEENYPGKWSYDSFKTEKGWNTLISWNIF